MSAKDIGLTKEMLDEAFGELPATVQKSPATVRVSNF